MKIAIVSFGHVDVILPLVKHLSGSNVDVSLFLCFSLKRKFESILDFSDKEISTGFTDRLKTDELLGPEILNYLGDDIKVHFFIFKNQKLRSLMNLFLSKILTRRLKNYDIIHFNGINGVLPVLIYMLRKKRLLFTIHDIQSHSGEKTRFNFSERISRYILKSKYPVIIHNLSDFRKVQQDYFSLKDKYRYIPFGEIEVYREFKEEGIESEYSDLLFFGRFSPYKGIEYLISSLQILDEKSFSIKTIIAGNGEVYFDITNLSDLGVVLINRYIPTKELVSLIRNTKIIVCPYTDATQSGVVMTAFAFNKPIIATNVGNFPEIIKNGLTGSLISPYEPNELADKIQFFLKDTDLLNVISLNIQKEKLTGDYSWSKISQKTKDLYSSILY